MEHIKNWESLQDFFSVLNENVEYLVLRNYEDFIEGRFNTSHPDIDVLCRDSNKFIHYAGSISRTKNRNDLMHQQVKIGNTFVSIDVRHVGDGYYDESWEVDMLSKRRLINNFCYVMDNENYYYSLLYHALIQKKTVGKDYQQRLEKMSETLHVDNVYGPVSIDTLQSYMRKRNYYFTYPENPTGIANFNEVDRLMIRKNKQKVLDRRIASIKRVINRILNF